jgi:hypothetical protein
MSTDFSIRPVGAPAVTTSFLPSASEAARGGVATQTPPSQSVTPTDASVSVRNDPQDSSAFVSHEAYFDRAAGSFVFEVVNSRTDQVVQQFPDEAVLRRRAYFHALDLTKEASTRPLATDVKA